MNSPGSIAKLTSSTAVTEPKVLRTRSSMTAAPDDASRSIAPEAAVAGGGRTTVMVSHASSPQPAAMAMRRRPRYREQVVPGWSAGRRDHGEHPGPEIFNAHTIIASGAGL